MRRRVLDFSKWLWIWLLWLEREFDSGDKTSNNIHLRYAQKIHIHLHQTLCNQILGVLENKDAKSSDLEDI